MIDTANDQSIAADVLKRRYGKTFQILTFLVGKYKNPLSVLFLVKKKEPKETKETKETKESHAKKVLICN
jgi:hypothetical protein